MLLLEGFWWLVILYSGVCNILSSSNQENYIFLALLHDTEKKPPPHSESVHEYYALLVVCMWIFPNVFPPVYIEILEHKLAQWHPTYDLYVRSLPPALLSWVPTAIPPVYFKWYNFPYLIRTSGFTICFCAHLNISLYPLQYYPLLCNKVNR